MERRDVPPTCQHFFFQNSNKESKVQFEDVFWIEIVCLNLIAMNSAVKNIAVLLCRITRVFLYFVILIFYIKQSIQLAPQLRLQISKKNSNKRYIRVPKNQKFCCTDV